MERVLLDANVLILPFQQNIALFDELDRLLGTYQTFTLRRTYNEARDAADGKYRQLVERLVADAEIEIIDIEGEGSVDGVLIELSDEYLICTNDKAVREALRELERPHLYLRGKHHLEGYALSD